MGRQAWRRVAALTAVAVLGLACSAGTPPRGDPDDDEVTPPAPTPAPDVGGLPPATPETPATPQEPLPSLPEPAGVSCSGPGLPTSTWLRLLPWPVGALAVAPDGDVLYGAVKTLWDGNIFEDVGVLGRMGPDGTPRWERDDFPSASAVHLRELNVAPRGAIYAWGYRDRTSYASDTGYRFDADGSNAEVIGSGNDETTFFRYQEDERGDLLHARVTSGHFRLSLDKTDGTHWGIGAYAGDEPGPFEVMSGTLTREGQVLLGANLYGRHPFRGMTLGQEEGASLVVLRLSGTGAPVWSFEVPGNAWGEVEEAGSGGPLVGHGHLLEGPLAWPGALPGGPLQGSGHLVFTLGSDGTPGWARLLKWDDVAGSPQGDVAVVTSEPGLQGGWRVRLRVFSASGAEVSDRTLATGRNWYSLGATHVAYEPRGTLLVSGSFLGRVEFDGRACTAREDLYTGFVMRVPAR